MLPGTSIRFGAVDEPVGAPGSVDDNVFLISGTDGNPQEGGTLFTAPTGQFQTAGGGAGPGDALVVFGKAVEGNSDLVSAVTVASVNSQTSLTASSAFNRNDTTGVSVDYGSVLPYLIGRAQHGNISSPETTNDIGVAHTTLNYTVNSVGSAVAIWAQGDGVDNVTSGQRSVVDAGTLVYPGVAPATLVVSPLTIAGNTTQYDHRLRDGRARHPAARCSGRLPVQLHGRAATAASMARRTPARSIISPVSTAARRHVRHVRHRRIGRRRHRRNADHQCRRAVAGHHDHGADRSYAHDQCQRDDRDRSDEYLFGHPQQQCVLAADRSRQFVLAATSPRATRQRRRRAPTRSPKAPPWRWRVRRTRPRRRSRAGRAIARMAPGPLRASRWPATRPARQPGAPAP